MVELLKEEMACLRSLCKEQIDVALLSCIEGKMGRAWVDRKSSPSIAVVVAADFCFLLGCITKERALVADNFLEKCKGKLVVIEDKSWISLIEIHYPNNLTKMKRYSMKCDFNEYHRNALEKFVKTVEPEYVIEKIGEPLYYKILEDKFMADCCSNFASLNDFLKHGIGYAVVQNGEIISAASSYSYCEGKIDITIGTKDEFRRKGLALATTSRLILHCLERNIYPCWEAANLRSVALAEKLGYSLNREFEVFFVS